MKQIKTYCVTILTCKYNILLEKTSKTSTFLFFINVIILILTSLLAFKTKKYSGYIRNQSNNRFLIMYKFCLK